jgi:very-short-patch-repair endonuclease
MDTIVENMKDMVLMDDVFIRECGAPRKDHLVIFLRKNFREDADFCYTFFDDKNKWGGHNKVNYYMTTETADLVKTSYNLKNKYIQTIKNVSVKAVVPGIEFSTIGFICNTLKSLPITLERQFVVERTLGRVYYIDLYIPELKLAIECDEFGHQSYNKVVEKRRQSFIEHKLSCTFIRFNPCVVGFDLSNVIGDIFLKYTTVM